MPSRPQRLTAEILKQGPDPYVRVPPAVSTAFANGLAVAHAVAPYVVEDMRWASLKSHTISPVQTSALPFPRKGGTILGPPLRARELLQQMGMTRRAKLPTTADQPSQPPQEEGQRGTGCQARYVDGRPCRRPAIAFDPHTNEFKCLHHLRVPPEIN